MARNALPSLTPSRAEMDRRHAPHLAARAAAVRIVDRLLLARPNSTLRDLYDAACSIRDDVTDTDAAKAIRVELLGRLRRAA